LTSGPPVDRHLSDATLEDVLMLMRFTVAAGAFYAVLFGTLC